MKTISFPHDKPERGPTYWRSLEQLAESPEFCRWIEQEFPQGATEMADPISRRHFMRIMSASFMLAGVGLTGCRRPEEGFYPFSRMPENYGHGMPQYFATSMPFRGGAQPLLVKSCDGRPVKIEGNPQHPYKIKGTNHFAQASILSLYDPDRAMRCTHNGNDVPRTAAIDFLTQFSKDAFARQGKNLSFLMEWSSSPSRARLQSLLKQRLPQAQWFHYEPLDWSLERQASSIIIGRSVRPYYQMEQASVILSLDCDFLGAHPDSTRLIHAFARSRQVENPSKNQSRLYIIESLLTLTGANADHRLKLPSSMAYSAIGRLAQEFLKQGGANLAEPAKIFLTLVSAWGKDFPGKSEWIEECVRDLLANPGKSLIMTGCHQPLAVHVTALAMNSILGNLGKTLVFLSTPDLKDGAIQDLAKLLQSGEVENLVILGGNPVYNAPADLNWAETQRKAKTVIRLGTHEDETFPFCDWHLPAAHFLESWGDARSSDGTLLSIQPLIEPLFGGFSELEILARIAGVALPNPYEMVRETFKSYVPSSQLEEAWKRFLHDGFLAQSAQRPVLATPVWKEAQAVLGRFKPSAKHPDANQFELVFHQDCSIDDGGFSNNGWLQEMPDPITKLAWENAFLISPKTAAQWQLKSGEIIEIQQNNRMVRGPVFLQPGMAHFVVGCALGYGRSRAGRVGQNIGFNVYPLRTGEHLGFAVSGTWKKTGSYTDLTTTQEHGAMEGRPIVLEANREQYLKQPDIIRRANTEHHHLNKGSLHSHPKMTGLQQWGMTIDLSLCIGCTACMAACQSENNIPIVGKDQVKRGREMHWIRIDRYYASDPGKSEEAAEDPQVVSQPMMCQHCENAPCETVCPVNATVHDEDGLNVMVYNRCVGTRYCANNCPYKVRRFNHFDFNKRPLDKLYYGPLARRPADELEMAKLAKNPDVTVRMRGVMEKCTFCVQRIEQAKIARKTRAGASGDVKIPDGVILPACSQACPAEAIVFGDVSDPNSQVSQSKAQPRNYSVLGYLDTQPRATYLARIRNPNPRMPDYHPMPASMAEYAGKEGWLFSSNQDPLSTKQDENNSQASPVKGGQ